MSHYPSLMEARVVNVDVPRRRLIVDIPSSQMLGIGVKMMIHGPADGMRVSHSAMPGRGTWGLVAFLYGSSENGLWLGSFYPALDTALTSHEDQFLEYNSHWSGAFDMLDQLGRYTKSFPDGTYLQVSDTDVRPAVNRQTVDPQQNQQLTALTDDQRVPNKPTARIVTVKHASGTTITIGANGDVTVNTAPNTKIALTAPTEVDITTDHVVIKAPLVSIDGNLEVTGGVTAGKGTGDQVTLQQHRHGTGGTTASSTVVPSPGT